jgi:hypothetical protein
MLAKFLKLNTNNSERQNSLGPHVGEGQRPQIPWTSMRESATQRRAAALLHGKGVTVKLWEEPDLKSESDDACGGRRSFWAE